MKKYNTPDMWLILSNNIPMILNILKNGLLQTRSKMQTAAQRLYNSTYNLTRNVVMTLIIKYILQTREANFAGASFYAVSI